MRGGEKREKGGMRKTCCLYNVIVYILGAVDVTDADEKIQPWYFDIK